MAGEVGSVGTSRGMTINLENYESARVDVWCTMPSSVEKVDDMYKTVAGWVDERLQKEVVAVREMVEKRKAERAGA